MALAKKCDRCGRLHEEYVKKDRSYKFNSIITCCMDEHNYPNNKEYINLCQGCKDSFKTWFKQVKESNG